MRDEVLDELVRRDELASLEAAMNRIPKKFAEAIREYYGIGRPQRTQLALAVARGVVPSTIFDRIKRGVRSIRRNPNTCRDFAEPPVIHTPWGQR